MVLPTVILPGYLAGAPPYRPLEAALIRRGIPTAVVPLRQRDWIPTIGGRSITPILEKLDQTVQQIRQSSGAASINLIGHSAGGWVARIYLGHMAYTIHPQDRQTPHVWDGQAFVQTLVCLGTPHHSQERWTRRNLEFVNTTYPGAFYSSVRYICVAGKSVFGKRKWFGPSFAYQSYQLTCGNGDCWGDGITPIAAAHLEGAENITLDNVNHSPKPGQLWYGSESVLESWVPFLQETGEYSVN